MDYAKSQNCTFNIIMDRLIFREIRYVEWDGQFNLYRIPGACIYFYYICYELQNVCSLVI